MSFRLVLVGGVVLWLAGRLVPGAGVLALAGTWVAMAFAPGWALARLAAPQESAPLSVARAMFLGPLFSGGLGLALLLAGLPVAPVSWVLLLVGFGLGAASARRPESGATPTDWERRLGVWMILLALVVLVPHVAREWVRIRSDAVFHSAVALEIAARGAPPDDPYFAGLPLNYPWFYHALVAVMARAAAVAPWHVTGFLQCGWLASLAGAAFAVSRRLGRSETESFFAAVFLPLGLSALFYAWLPLKLIRGVMGESAGREHVEHLLSLRPFTWDRVHEVQSSWKSAPPVINKYLVMTAWGGAFTALAWLTDGTAAVLRVSRFCVPRLPLLLLAAATYGAWVLNPAMGLLTGVGGGVALGLLLLFPGGVSRGASLRVVWGYALGFAPAALLVMTTVGRAENRFPFGFDVDAWGGVIVGCTAALLLGVPTLVRLSPGPGTRLARSLALGLGLASAVVVLPPPNTIDKVSFTVYLVPALAAGWLLGSWWTRAPRRRILVGALTAAILAPVNVLFVSVLLAEPDRSRTDAIEDELHGWLAENTSSHSVVLDTADRVDVLVRVPRRQYFGRDAYSTMWGYPTEEMARRRAVCDALVNPATVPVTAKEQASAHRELVSFAAGLETDVYVVIRPRDFAGGTIPELGPPEFEPVRGGPGPRVYRVVP